MFHKRSARSATVLLKSSTLLLGSLFLCWLRSPEIARSQVSEAAESLADQQVVTHDQAPDQRKSMADQAPPSVTSVKYASVYNWRQFPTAPAALVVGSNTITLSPCPKGFFVHSDNYPPTQYVYIAGQGKPETTLATRVSGHSGDSSCRFRVTTAFAHRAGYAVGSASGGIKEASEAARDQNGGSTNVNGGYVLLDAAGAPYNVRAPLHFEASFQTVQYAGGRIECYVAADDCIVVGSRASQLTTTNVVLNDIVIHAANGNIVDFAWDAIHDNAQSTVIRNPRILYSRASVSGEPIGSFNSYVSVCDDEALELDGLYVLSSAGLRADRRGQIVYALPEGHTRNANNCYAVGWLKHINGNMQCGGNVVTWLSGNGLRVSDSVIQGFSQYGIRTGAPTGGYNGNTQIDNAYFEVGGCKGRNGNPDYVAAGATGSSSGAQSGVITQGGIVTAHGSTGLVGGMPTFTCSGISGNTQFNYWLVATQSGASQGNGASAPLYLGNTPANCSGTLTGYFPKISHADRGTITYTILRTPGAGANIIVPYAGGCPGGSVRACGAVIVGKAPSGGVIESFTDDVSAGTKDYKLPAMDFVPYLGFWPGNLVLSAGSPSNRTQVPVAWFNGEQNLAGGTGVGIVSVNGSYSPSAFSLTGTAGQSGLLGGGTATLGSLSVQLGGFNTATLLMRNLQGYTEAAGLKGRLNFIGTNLAGFHNGSIITLVDSAPDKTTATSNYRPLMDATDVWIGTDNTAYAGRTNMPLAFGAPLSISGYIHSLPDGTNWKERLTANEKTLAVPLVIKDGNTFTLGAGTPLSQMKIYSTNKLPRTPVPGQSCLDLTGTAVGLSAADEVAGIRPPAALGNLSLNAYPKGANEVTLHFCNPGTLRADTPAGAYSFLGVH